MSAETITLPLDKVMEWRESLRGGWQLVTTTERLADAIDAALWTPPVSHVEWIDCAEHPHPTDGSLFLARYCDCSVVHTTWGKTSITHWALINLPEVKP